MGGWHLRMTWGQEVCYASFQWTPASALSLPTVWSHWGNPGVTRCQEMASLPAGYIPHCENFTIERSRGYFILHVARFAIFYHNNHAFGNALLHKEILMLMHSRIRPCWRFLYNILLTRCNQIVINFDMKKK